MTAKEKAIELANKAFEKNIFEIGNEELRAERLKAKKKAIRVCEILINTHYRSKEREKALFYEEVKTEIEIL